MLNIAIIEDEQEASDVFVGFLKRFQYENGVECKYFIFKDAISFLTNYKAIYDIVFMDILLPNMNGMDAAKKLRQMDKLVSLIFVTNMAQYAVKGYEVQAIDFIVKPVGYYNFSLKLQRALETVKERGDVKIAVHNEGNVVCVRASDIIYVEVFQHSIIYHTINSALKTFGSLAKVENLLPKNSFARCNSCYLVNLRYVSSVNGLTAYLGDTKLQISRMKRKDFLNAINNYLGGGL